MEKSTLGSATCPKCGGTVPPGSAGGTLCEACLLLLGLDAENTEPLSLADLIDGKDGGAVFHAFGDYEILEEIARGGMGVVFRAHQISLSRSVALKFILAGRLHSKDARQRFRQEAEAAAQLEHPNIAPVYESGEIDGYPFLSMKYFAGGDLAAAIKEDEPQDPATLVAKVARAVHYAHGRGILHRDLKPSNILLDEDGEPHVTDFGLAKLAESDTSLTHSGAMLGTPSYMSPEQCRGGSGDLSVTSDIYALGVILYELLSGKVPFQGDSTLEVMRQVVEEAPKPPATLHGSRLGSRDLATICLKCLEKEPERRYESAAALAEDLDRVGRGEPIVARRVGTLERTVKWAKRKPALATMGAVAALAMITGTVLTFLQWREAEAMRAQAELNLYASDVPLAQRVWEEGNHLYARKLLGDHIPRSAGDPDPRGWEWFRLWSLLEGSAVKLTHDDPVRCVAVSPDDSMVGSGTDDGEVFVWDVASDPPAIIHRYPLRSGEGMAVGVAFSTDSRWFATLNFKTMGTATAAVYDLNGEHGPFLTEVQHRWNDSRCMLAFAGDYLVISGATVSAGTARPVEFPVQRWRFQNEPRAVPVGGATDRMAVSRDGQFLAAGLADGRIGLWSTRTWERTRVLGEPAGAGHTSIRFSPSGERVVRVVEGTAEVLNVATGETEHRIETNNTEPAKKEARDAVFADEDTLVVDSGFLTVAWALETDGGESEPAIVLREHEAGIRELAAFHGSDRVASASDDKTVRIWKLTPFDGQQLTMEPAITYPLAPVLSADGSLMATLSSEQGRVTIFDTATGEVVSTLGGDPYSLELGDMGTPTQPREARPRSVVLEELGGRTHLKVIGKDGQEVAAGFAEDFPDWEIEWRLMEEQLQVYRKKLAALGAHTRKDRAEIADRRTRGARENVIHHALLIAEHEPRPWLSFGFSEDGETLITANIENPAQTAGFPPLAPPVLLGFHYWDFRRNPTAPAKTVRWEEPIDLLVKSRLSPDGKTLVTGHERGRIVFWDFETGRKRFEVEKEGTGAIVGIDFSPDGKRFAWNSTDGLFLYDVGKRQIIQRGEGTRQHLVSLWFSPDGRFIATGARDNAVRIIDVEDPDAPEIHLYGHQGFVKRVAWSPDGKTLASLDVSRTQIKVWNVATWREAGSLDLPGARFVQFSPDGRRLYSGTREQIVVWEAERE